MRFPSAVKALNPSSAPVPSRTMEQRERQEERKEAKKKMKSEVLKEVVEERREEKVFALEGGGSKAEGQSSSD